MDPHVTEEGLVVEVPRVVKHPRQRFAQWREESLNELLPLAVPVVLFPMFLKVLCCLP